MDPITIITTAASFILKPIGDWFAARSARQAAALDSEIKIAEAKTNATIKRLQTTQEADIAWENLSIQNAGWKDEWFVILLSIPAILCFFGEWGAAWVTAGFLALKGTPDWYQWAFLVAVASSFGYKKIADFMALKKGA